MTQIESDLFDPKYLTSDKLRNTFNTEKIGNK